MLKFFLAIVLVLLALFTQLFLASAGWHYNLTFAALIAAASALDLAELLVCDLLAVFLLNWEPRVNVALLLFAVIPLAAWVFKRVTRSRGWAGNLAALASGFLLFYAITAPSFLAHAPGAFLFDLIVGCAVGELIWAALSPTYEKI
jgi:hypothetical protein